MHFFEINQCSIRLIRLHIIFNERCLPSRQYWCFIFVFLTYLKKFNTVYNILFFLCINSSFVLIFVFLSFYLFLWKFFLFSFIFHIFHGELNFVSNKLDFKYNESVNTRTTPSPSTAATSATSALFPGRQIIWILNIFFQRKYSDLMKSWFRPMCHISRHFLKITKVKSKSSYNFRTFDKRLTIPQDLKTFIIPKHFNWLTMLETRSKQVYVFNN